jgi:hypothetical protein
LTPPFGFVDCILLAVTLGRDAQAQDAASASAIRSIIAQQVVAWNTGDGERYASNLAPTPHLQIFLE